MQKWLKPTWDDDESPPSLKKKNKKDKADPPSSVEPDTEEAGQGELNGQEMEGVEGSALLSSSQSPVPTPSLTPVRTPVRTPFRTLAPRYGFIPFHPPPARHQNQRPSVPKPPPPPGQKNNAPTPRINVQLPIVRLRPSRLRLGGLSSLHERHVDVSSMTTPPPTPMTRDGLAVSPDLPLMSGAFVNTPPPPDEPITLASSALKAYLACGHKLVNMRFEFHKLQARRFRGEHGLQVLMNSVSGKHAKQCLKLHKVSDILRKEQGAHCGQLDGIDPLCVILGKPLEYYV
ncbi:hypothetical protein CTA2_1558 [Colletotrichum tanaceti]|uniref:Uncharacterized protein n=1 Tax=Colletotrichum tanaceti TaxID=1306861 RepID=A0A4U6XTZ3_9PEZI|nr:hypothetical protein CTA2_1558 [Colletotrichum tanaceti]TKW59473.1 hypothetical protein CTA1_11483 [Colletotrichum tanaceti]